MHASVPLHSLTLLSALQNLFPDQSQQAVHGWLLLPCPHGMHFRTALLLPDILPQKVPACMQEKYLLHQAQYKKRNKAHAQVHAEINQGSDPYGMEFP